MSHKSWLNRFLKGVSKSSRTAPRQRPAFSPVRMELLEDRTAPATLTWTGAAGTNWNDAGNWTGGGVPSAANNVLNFTAGASVAKYTSNNDIPGLTGITINITDAVATSGSDFTIGGTSSVGITALTNNKTDSGTSATTVTTPLSGTGATITATAGVLAITNTANTFDAASSLNVPTGGTATIFISGASSVGNAKINLTGGALNVDQGTLPSAPGLYWDINETVGNFTGAVTPSGKVTDAIGAGLSGSDGTADAQTVKDDLNPNGIKFWVTSANSADNMTYIYQGQIFDADGIFSLGKNIDDFVSIMIDGKNYLNSTAWNTPQSTTALKPDNDFGMGPASDGWHDIDIRLGEFGGGAGTVTGGGWTRGAVNINAIDYPSFGFGISVDGTGGADGSQNIPIDTAQKVANGAAADIKLRHLLPVVPLTNAVSVSGNSTVNLSANLRDGANFATLSMAAGGSLAVNAAKSGQTLRFSGATTLAGSETITTGAGANLRLSGQITGAGGFTKAGAGSLTLDGAGNNYTGANVVNAGTVFLGADSALGAISAGTTVNTGGKIALRANYNAAEPLTISGGATTTSIPGFKGDYYYNAPALDPTYLQPATGINLGIESTTLVASVTTPRVDFGGNAAPDSTATPTDYANVAGGPDGVPLDRAAANSGVNIFGGVGVASPSTDHIGGVWTGTLKVTVAGTYRFTTRSDDGSRLWLNTTDLVVDNNFDQGMTNRSGDRTLAVGSYPIKIAFEENGGGWGMQAYWARIVGGAEDTAFPRHIINDNVYDLGAAVSQVAFSTAPFESTGNFNFNGPITLGAAAQIRASSGTLTLNGGINTGSNALLFGGTGTAVVATAGISGSGQVRRVEGGTTQLSVANTFSGGTEIENGKVLFAVNVGTGTVHVAGFTSLIYTGATDLTYAGALNVDNNGNIASRNAKLTISTALSATGVLNLNNDSVNDNYVILTAPIALTKDFSVQVGGGAGNGGVGVLAGVISGGFGINKTGPGILAPSNNGNTYTGTNTVSGTLAAAAPNAFGATTAGTVAINGGSIGVAADPAGLGNFTLNPAEPLSISGAGAGGIGALVNVQGNNTVNNTVTFAGSATIGSLSGKLTVSGPLSVPAVADVNFAGAGDIDVTQAFGNGSSVLSTKALFAQYQYDASSNRTGSDMTGVGAAPGNQGLLVPGTVWLGSGILKGALNVFDNNSPATPATINGASGFSDMFGKNPLDITNFVVYYSGQMNVTQAGDYKFATGNIANLSGLLAPDAAGAVYVDINKNHIFEDSNNELLLDTQTASVSAAAVHLNPGTYDILIPFTNGGGSGGMNISYSSNGGTSYQLIDPSATVANTNFTAAVAPKNNVNKSGTGVVTLLGNNTYNGTTTINSGTLVAGSNSALGVGASVAVNKGGSLGLPAAGGVTIPATKTISLVGPGAGIVNLGGANTVAAPITLTGDASIGSNAGTLTINGTGINVSAYTLTVTGAGDTTISAPITGVDTSGPGLVVGQRLTNDVNVYGAFGTAPDPSYGSDIDLTLTMGYKASNDAPLTPTTNRTWATNDTWFYQGQMFWPNSNGDGTGTLSFAENIDDDAYMWVDGVQKLNNTSWNTPTSTGPITLPTGWHNIDVRFSNGGGGAGAVAGTGWSATFGFGYRIDLDPNPGGHDGSQDPAAMSTDGNDYIQPKDNGTGNMFRTGLISANGLVKTGAGTLNLNGANTYKRNTVITGGTVNTGANNAFGTDPNATLTVSGATTVVNLFNSATAVTTVASADFSDGTGTVNTGTLGGKLAIKSLQLGGGYKVSGDMTAQGANLVDNAVQRTFSAVTGTLDVVGVSTPITVVDKGTLFANSNQNNTFSFTASNGAEMLVVAIDDRSSNAGVLPTVTYNGIPLKSAVGIQSLTSTYINSHIFYLANPPTGAAQSLVVNFNNGLASNSGIYAFTLKGVSPTATPIVASLNTEGSPDARAITLANVPAGSVGITTGNYRIGVNGPITSNATSGTSIVNGAGGGGGNFWTSNDATTITHGALVTNLAAGSTTFNSTAAGASGTRWVFVAAAFAPKNSAPTAINLPATNFFLPTGTILKVAGPGDSVIGSVSYAGNATVAPSAVAPASLTIGGTGGAGTGSLATTLNLGLKLSAGSSFKVDVNGTTAGSLYDQVNVNGAVNLTGATLNVTTGAGFTPTVGNTFTIISNDVADAVTGTFAGIAEGGVVFGGTSAYTVSYKGGDGNDVVLTATTAGAATTTTLVATPLATTGGTAVQFTATVAPSPGALGTVAFLDNGVAITGGSNIAVVGGVAVFSTTTLAVGSHPVTAAYSGAAGFAPSTSNLQTVVVSAGGTTPAINTITFNGGLTGFTAAQRSRIVNATVEFNQPVILDTGAMTLALHTNNVNYAGNTGGTGQPNGAAIPATLTPTASTDSKTWTLTWSGANTEVGSVDQLASLKDGVYDLLIDATKVHPVGSPTVNMAANSTTVFHRLFGDTNAPAANGNDFTAVLAGNDNLAFRGAFNKPVGGGYVPFLDFNGDGNINSGDNLAFRARFNKNLTWTV